MQRAPAMISSNVVAAVAADVDPGQRELRGSLVTSQLLGLWIVRKFWCFEPLASTPDDVVVDYVAPTVQRYLTQNLG